MTHFPIQRRKLSDDVRERLLAQIHEGKLPPGSPLPSERELMEAYGVGRPAIREAMQSLQGLGMIVVRHGERPRVAEPQLDLLAEQMALSMRHILTYDASILTQLKDARVILETQIARIAAETQTEDALAALRDALTAQEQAQDQPDTFLDLDGEFHAALAAMSGNALLAAVLRAIFAWLKRFHTEAVRQSGRERLTINEHTAIVEAVAAGDPDAAADAMRVHLTRASALYRSEAE